MKRRDRRIGAAEAAAAITGVLAQASLGEIPEAVASEQPTCPADAVPLPNPDPTVPANCAKCPTGMVAVILAPPQRGITCEKTDQRAALVKPQNVSAA